MTGLWVTLGATLGGPLALAGLIGLGVLVHNLRLDAYLAASGWRQPEDVPEGVRNASWSDPGPRVTRRMVRQFGDYQVWMVEASYSADLPALDVSGPTTSSVYLNHYVLSLAPFLDGRAFPPMQVFPRSRFARSGRIQDGPDRHFARRFRYPESGAYRLTPEIRRRMLRRRLPPWRVDGHGYLITCYRSAPSVRTVDRRARRAIELAGLLAEPQDELP